jgi:hypothetical protein
MSKQPDKAGQAWSQTDVARLRDLARRDTPTGLIAYHLQRSEDAVRSKASDEGISLKPVNQSPYNRHH